MFEMTGQSIDGMSAKDLPADPRAGAYVCFEGLVRNHNDGKAVKLLEYESYQEMADKVGQQIVEEAIEKFDLRHARCVHRFGTLQIGEVAVWVGCTSDHREEAFKGAQYIIDEVKLRVPIWKKEHYEAGEPVWVQCHRCSHTAHH